MDVLFANRVLARETETFFGDFLSSNKKLPARLRAEAIKQLNNNQKRAR
jgi:hypothetical protein